MELYSSSRAFHEVWLAKRWMDYDRAPWLDVNVICAAVNETYDNSDGYHPCAFTLIGCRILSENIVISS